jgi:hypothetical protein
VFSNTIKTPGLPALPEGEGIIKFLIEVPDTAGQTKLAPGAVPGEPGFPGWRFGGLALFPLLPALTLPTFVKFVAPASPPTAKG